MATVYLRKLNWITTDSTLRGAFSEYGNVTDAVVDRDPETNRAKGTGRVTFGAENEAESAAAAMDQQDLDGSRIRVSLSPDDSSSDDSGSGFGGSVSGHIDGYGGSVGGGYDSGRPGNSTSSGY
ncbi:RNA recognition motif domain-containing protein [Streptomyces microflavus]|uniref:RNA-binding protein n=1 Tax=Streptomyces microflavus TaxID=1919 RepID=A0ABV1QE63_STRMI